MQLMALEGLLMDDPLTIPRLLRRLDCDNVSKEILAHCRKLNR